MEKFTLHILGCGSALPTGLHLPSSQIISLRERLYMIDCGEGTQLQMRKAGLKFSRLSCIFITHLHGDHCFGLIGLISTFSLLGRTTPLHIYAPAELEQVLKLQLSTFCYGLSFPIEFHAINTTSSQVIYEDKALTVQTMPLKHRIACCGFIFREKPSLPHIRRDMIDFYQIPLYAINQIKQGADWTTTEGEHVPNRFLVYEAQPPRSFAYCSDTAYCPSIIPLIRNVNLLYHEATFGENNKQRAKETYHSTATEAAQIAQEAAVGKLLIGHYSARYTDTTPLLEEAQAIFPHTIAATEGMILHIE